MKIFGPVPSRRLGKSVGINNIPPKICTYTCVYCQLGRSLKMIADRREFYKPKDLYEEVKKKIQDAEANDERIDYLTFVPDGEPILDKNLGKIIKLLKPLGIKIAVISNSTLIDLPDARSDLMGADWVSLKVDTVDEELWRKIDRPIKAIKFNSMMDGIVKFADEFEGELTTETMLVKDLNEGEKNMREVSEFLGRIKPSVAYLSIPTRPPAEEWVNAPEEETINKAYHILSENVPKAEYLIGYEGNEFAFTGNVEEDILSITSVHPMREDALEEYLRKANGDFSSVEKLVEENKIIVSEFKGRKFYLRKLKA